MKKTLLTFALILGTITIYAQEVEQLKAEQAAKKDSIKALEKKVNCHDKDIGILNTKLNLFSVLIATGSAAVSGFFTWLKLKQECYNEKGFTSNNVICWMYFRS